MPELSPLDELRAMGATENVTERAKGYMEPDEEFDNSAAGQVFKELNEDGTIMRVKVGEKNYKDLQVLDAITKSKASTHENNMSYWSGEIAKKEFIMEDPNTPIEDLGKIHNDIAYAKEKYNEELGFYKSARALHSKNLSETGLGLAEGLGGIVSGAGYALKRYGKDVGLGALSRGGGYLAEFVEGEMQGMPEQKPGALNYVSRVFGRTMPWFAAMFPGMAPVVMGAGGATGLTGFLISQTPLIGAGIVLGHGQMQGALEKEGVTDDATQAKATYLYGTMIGALQAAVPVAVLRGLSKPATKAFYGSIGQIAAKAAAGTLHMSIAQAMTMEMTTWAEMYGVSDASGKPLDLKLFEERANEAMLEGFVSGAMFGGLGEAHKMYAGAYKRGKDPQKDFDAVLDEIKEVMEEPVKIPGADGETAAPVPPERSPVARRAVLEAELSDLTTDRSPEASARRTEIEARLAKPELPDYAPEEFAKIEELRTKLDEIDQIVKDTEARTDITDDEKAYVVDALGRESYVEEIKALEQEAEARRAEWQKSPDEVAADEGRPTATELDTPDFEDIRPVLPKDANGHPDVTSLPDTMEAKFGKRKFSELTPDEKRQLYYDLSDTDGGFKSEIEAEGERVSRVTNELARIEAKIDDIRDQDGITESEREALIADLAVHRDYVARDLEPRHAVREGAPGRAAPKIEPAVAETVTELPSKETKDFVPGPNGSKYRISKVFGGRVLFEEVSSRGGKESFYIGNDGELIDTKYVYLNNPSTTKDLWTPSTDAARNMVEGLLDEVGKSSSLDEIRNLNDKIKKIVSDDVAGQQVVREVAPERPARSGGEVPQKPSAKTAIDPVKQAAFRETLRGNTSRKTWMRDLGVTKEELDALIDDARERGLVRIDKHGVVRRTALARSGEANKTLITGPDGASTISEAAESSYADLQNIVKKAVSNVTGEGIIEVVAKDVLEERGVIAGDENLALTKYQTATENFADGRTEEQRGRDNARRETLGDTAYQLEQRLNQETGALGTKEGNPEARRVMQRRLDEADREARITRSDATPRREDGSVVVGRQSTAKAARKPGAARQPMKAGGTEHFNKVPGFDGRVTDVPVTEYEKRTGIISKITYRLYDKGAGPATIETADAPVRVTVELMQRSDGAWETNWLHVSDESRGKGLATKTYAAIEKDLGIRMSPSGTLSDKGFAFWKKRSPDSVQWHQQDPRYPDIYVSPRKISDEISRVGREMSRRGANMERLKKERAVLMAMWGKLSPEAKAAKDDMLALRGFYHAPLRAVQTSKQTKATPEQWLSAIRRGRGVQQDQLDWMGLEQWLDSGSWRRYQLLSAALKDKDISEETLFKLVDAIDNGENPRSVIDTVPELERAALTKHIKQSFESNTITKEIITEFIESGKADVNEVYDPYPAYSIEQYSPFGSRGSNYRMLFITYPKAEGVWFDPHHEFRKHGPVMTFGRMWDLPRIKVHRPLSEAEEVERAVILKRHDDLEAAYNEKWTDVDLDPYKDGERWTERDAEWSEISYLWDKLTEYSRREDGYLRVLGVGDVQSPPHQRGFKEGYITEETKKERAAAQARLNELNIIYGNIEKYRIERTNEINSKYAPLLDPHDQAASDATGEVISKFNSGDIDEKTYFKRLDDIQEKYIYDTSEIMGKINDEKSKLDLEIQKMYEEYYDKYGGERDRIAEKFEGDPVFNFPFKGDRWFELQLKHILRYAVENGYDAIQLASATNMRIAVGMSRKFSQQLYDRKFPWFLNSYVKKWGAKVEDVSKPPRVEDVRNIMRDISRYDDERILEFLYDEELGRGEFPTDKIESRATEMRNQINDALAEGVYRYETGERFEDAFNWNRNETWVDGAVMDILGHLYEPNGGGKILHFTPEMRRAILEGQPLSLAGSDAAPRIRGKGSAYDMTISLGMKAIEAQAAAKGVTPISEAIRTARHEALEIFRDVGVILPEEMNILRRAARRYGWVESQGVRDLYEKYYRDRGLTPEEMEALVEKEAIFEQFAEFESGKKTFDSNVQAIFQKIKDFFDRLTNYLRGDGWQTHDDIFTKYNEGELAKRYAAETGISEPRKPVSLSTDERLALARRPDPIEAPLTDIRAELGLKSPEPWVKVQVRKQFYDILASKAKITVKSLTKKLGISTADVNGLLNDAINEGWLTRDPSTNKWRRVPENQRPGMPELDVSIRQQIVHIATDGGNALLQHHGQKIESWLAVYGMDVESYALPYSTDPVGEGFSRFFKDFVLRPATTRLRHRKLYDDFRDYLDNESPDLLEALDKVRDLQGDRLAKLRAGTTPSSLIVGSGVGGHYAPKPPLPAVSKIPFAKTSRVVVDWWQRNFQPELVSPKALLADAQFARFKSAKAQEQDMIEARDDALFNYWRKVDRPTKIQFMKDVEVGAPQPTKELQDIADRYRKLLDISYNLEIRFGSKAGYIEDYFPHIWKRPEQARDFVKNRSAVDSLGPKWFQKARFYDLIEEGMKAGLELKSDNPQELITWRLLAGADMRQKMELLRELQKMGLANEVKGAPNVASKIKSNTDLINIGWKAINAPDRRQWLIAPDIQPLWQNAIDARGLWQTDHPIGSIFRGWMSFKNAWVPIKLAVSAFHPLHVVHIAWSNNLTHALTLLTRNKDPKAAAMALATFWNTRGGRGYLAKHAWLKPREERTPLENAMVDLMNDGGFSPQLSEQLRIAARRGLAKALDESNIFGVGFQGLRRSIEIVQAPVFEHWIPAVKAAAYLREAEAFLARRPDLINNPELRRVGLRHIAKSVDNRFGEMFYGTLFWNRAIKDAGIGSFLSLGWNLGFVREFGGGVAEIRGRLLKPYGKLTDAEKVIRDASTKSEFAFIYLFTAMIIGGALTHGLSGEWPSEIKDYVFPRIGGTNPDGSPRRITTMFYNREVPMLLKHIEEQQSVFGGLGTMIYHKMLFAPFVEMLTNRDYWGYEIFDESAPEYKQALQFGKFLLTDQLIPITGTGAARAAEQAGTWWDKGVPLSFLGFSPAPSYVERSALENRIRYYFQVHIAAQKKPYDREELDYTKRVAKTKLRLALQRGDTEAAIAARREAIKAGTDSSTLTRRRLNEPTSTYLFSRLYDEHQIDILKQAGPEEFKLYRKYAKQKVKRQFPLRAKGEFVPLEAK